MLVFLVSQTTYSTYLKVDPEGLEPSFTTYPPKLDLPMTRHSGSLSRWPGWRGRNFQLAYRPIIFLPYVCLFDFYGDNSGTFCLRIRVVHRTSRTRRVHRKAAYAAAHDC